MRKLSRKELLQILVTQSKQIEQLEAKLREAEHELDHHMLIMKEAGTMAEAALRLNHIFEDADAACRQYLNSIKAMAVREQGQH
jgi:chemotaxis regulatin CheY-phosphate phosphatase CheZ